MSACRCHPPLAATTAITPRYWNSDTFEGQVSPTSRDPENTSKIPLVLFCHANGFCKDIWKPVADELSAFAIAPFRWISMDFSGHGSSRKIRTGGTIDWQFAVEDVSEVLNEYRDGAPVVGVGHSMGATALLMSSLASREDDMGLRLLVLFEPILFPTSKSDNSFTDALCQSALRRRHTWTSSEEAQAYLARRPVFRRCRTPPCPSTIRKSMPRAWANCAPFTVIPVMPRWRPRFWRCTSTTFRETTCARCAPRPIPPRSTAPKPSCR